MSQSPSSSQYGYTSQPHQQSYSRSSERSFSNESPQLPTESFASPANNPSRLSASRSILSVSSAPSPAAYASAYGSGPVYQPSQARQQSYAAQDNQRSEVEQAILRSDNPIRLNEREQITVNGVRGIHANRSELANWRGPIPLEQYKYNVDNNPEVVRKRPTEKLRYKQEIAVKYLNPPTPPKPGDLIIRQVPGKQVPPAPPLVIRSLPQQPQNPGPLVLREAPPRPPSVFESKTVRIQAKALPPPPRRVVVEKFEPEPAKPAPIIIEKWLPYKPRKVKVILQKQQPCCQCCPQQQESQDSSTQLSIAPQSSNVFANSNFPIELEGDSAALDALRRVDLESYGLNEFRSALNRLNRN